MLRIGPNLARIGDGVGLRRGTGMEGASVDSRGWGIPAAARLGSGSERSVTEAQAGCDGDGGASVDSGMSPGFPCVCRGCVRRQRGFLVYATPDAGEAAERTGLADGWNQKKRSHNKIVLLLFF